MSLVQSDWEAPEGFDHIIEVVELVDENGDTIGLVEHEVEES